MQGLEDALRQLRDVGHSYGFEPATVLDIGVADGTPELYGAFPKARFLLVEPLQEFEPSLQLICARYNAQYVIAAADSREGTTTIHVTPDLAGSSILTPGETYVPIRPREVPTVTLDSLAVRFDLTPPFLLKVDAQSGELRVLQGAAQVLARCEAVILEVPFFQFVHEGPQFADIVAFMARAGFAAYDIVGHNYRPLDSALAEVDLVFVKSQGPFRTLQVYASPEQRNRQFAAPDRRF